MLEIIKKMFGKNNSALQELIRNGAVLVDVRTPAEYSEGYVKDSVNIPLSQIENQLQKFKGKEHIVVFCRSGVRSSQAKAILNANGFTNVTNGGTWTAIKNLTM